MEVGDRLRATREKRGMTQGELASKLGVSPVTVTLWENRKHRRQIGTKYLRKVAEALEIPVSELLGEQEAKPPQTGSSPVVARDLAETQLLRMFRLMPEELKLFQLAQFSECVTMGHLDHPGSHDHRRDEMSSVGGADKREPR
jgi:transcriptional regulator with XRE-family HTH domain